MPSIHNEQIKLLANAIDRASTACIAGGVVTPFAGWLVGHTTPLSLLAAFVYVWLFVGVGLHLLARRVLRGLHEE